MNYQTRSKIFGPPGSGKTTTAIDMVTDYLNETKGRVVFASFTRNARDTLLYRVPKNLKSRMEIRTIHSLAYRALGYDRNYIKDNLLKFEKFLGRQIPNDPDFYIPDKMLKDVLNFVGNFRNQRRNPESYEYPSHIPKVYVNFIVKYYKIFKDQENFADYDDILAEYVRKGDALKCDAMFIDEAQDLSALQWAAIERMSGNATYVAVFGDDDQGIFGWAGAESKNFLQWDCDTKEVLSKSYRLSRKVHQLALKIIEQVTEREPKEFNHNGTEGEVYHASRIDYDTDFRGYDSIGVLYRCNYHAKPIKEELHRRGIKYMSKGSPWEYQDCIDSIVAWENWRKTGTCGEDERELIQKHTEIEKIGTLKTCPDLPWYEALHIPFTDVYRRFISIHGIEKMDTLPKIELTTMHHAKGGEWDKVILLTEMSKKAYTALKTSQETAEQETRVWYVGVTRAKKCLQVMRPEGKFNYEFLARYRLERL